MSASPPTPSTAAASSRPPVAITTIICVDCVVGESVKIGNGTVLHPRVSITSPHGAPIIIGEHNIIEEFVKIVNNTNEPMIIGSRNLIEVGSVIECKSIGNDNVIESKAKVSSGCTIGNGCSIGAGVTLYENDIIDDQTIISGPSLNRMKSSLPLDIHSGLHEKHLQELCRMLPQFHNMK
ncbi:dynactin subunit p27 [Cavenderia fasciculata]|uniref:Dynactin subunit 6 n=1 Tax=Cavenderia fasciculata TaxID=261658 RepID=F4PYR4_CACFS|nr:dynactin subunit p27 [Cavenderia fasciculata]EGG19330.1 dynactin subunit p27 [Cavenderia fasciculata]|eukprot:XP_004357601.1 dynactin subunit p27 [Cavenderia fasciculata]